MDKLFETLLKSADYLTALVILSLVLCAKFFGMWMTKLEYDILRKNNETLQTATDKAIEQLAKAQATNELNARTNNHLSESLKTMLVILEYERRPKP